MRWAEVARGESLRYMHPLVGSPAAPNAALPVVVVVGVTPGPTLLLIAGEHGDDSRGRVGH
jgi:predicted deacylase